MHLLISCAVIIAVAVFFDRARVRANGLLFVLKDYFWKISRRVTFKRVIYTIGIVLFVLAAWRVIGIDWAFISIGADTVLYLEIASTVYLVAARGYIKQTSRLVVKAIAGKLRRSTASLRSRNRDRRSLRHNSSSGGENDDDADPAMVEAFAFS
jgi:hypothetical protein